MLNINKTFLLSSTKSFLADTSISLLTMLAVYIVDDNVRLFFKELPNEKFVLFFTLILFLLSYTLGLVINALSYFSYSWLIEMIELFLFRFELFSFHTKKLFSFNDVINFYAISNFFEFDQASTIVRHLSFVFKKIGDNSDYIPGLKQFFRNLAFLITIFISYKFFMNELELLVFFYCILTIFLLLLTCASLSLFYNCKLLYLSKLYFFLITKKDNRNLLNELKSTEKVLFIMSSITEHIETEPPKCYNLNIY